MKLAIDGGEKAVKHDPIAWPEIDSCERQAVLEVLESKKWFRYDGTKNDEFEEKFAKYVGTKYAQTFTNGTAAIETPLAVLGIGAGDEVIVPSYTFFSTSSAVSFVGATPVFCDIDPDTLNIDHTKIEALISPKTKAIIVVHFAGFPCQMDEIMEIANRHGLYVIEDASHAHGSQYKGKHIGTIGICSTFSFQASKNLTSGEGGATLTNDQDLYEKMNSRTTCGRKFGGAWYEHHGIASNLRLNEMAAAILLCQLEKLEKQTEERLRNAKYIEEAIAKSPYLKLCQQGDYSTRRAYHLLTTRFIPQSGITREDFIEALKAEGASCSGGYLMPLYKQPAYDHAPLPMNQKGSYKELYHENCEAICKDAIWFFHPLLLGDGTVAKEIATAIEKVSELIGK